MTDPIALLAALQLGDSVLPIGRFAHSLGLEAWLRDHEDATPDRIAELIEAVTSEAVAPADGLAVAYAHRSRELSELTELDAFLTARKLTPAARNASQSCGRQLAALAPRLAPDDRLVGRLASEVKSRETAGNHAVVHGTLARALGLSAREAVLIELRGSAASLLSAAVRLGAIPPTRAQVILSELTPAIIDGAETALGLELSEMNSTAPELELFSLAHAQADARMFRT